MRLVYTETGTEVRVGDQVTLRDGVTAEVMYVTKPHKPSSTGRVGLEPQCSGPNSPIQLEYFPSVIGAEWVEREDHR